MFCKQKTAYEMRISDWSSDVCSSDLALSYAARNDVKPGHLQALLEGYEGGLKGVVAAERAMRRPAESGRLAHSIEVRQWLRSAAPAVHIDFTPEGEEEFVLLVARRDATGLSVIDSVPHNAALVERRSEEHTSELQSL